MLICPNVSVARDVSMMHSMRPLKFHPYIYIWGGGGGGGGGGDGGGGGGGGGSSKSMKFPMDSYSITQRFFSLIVISSLTHVCRPEKVEKLSREAFRSLCSCLSPMDIVCLNTTFMWTYQMSWMGSLIMPMPLFQSSSLGFA